MRPPIVDEPQEPSAAGGRPGPPDSLALSGLVLAVLFWPVGLVLSVVALRRAPRTDRTIPLVGVVLSAVAAMVTTLAVLAAALYFILPAALFGWGGYAVDAAPVPEETLAVGEPADVGDLSVALTAATSTEDDSRTGPNPFAEDQQRATLTFTVQNDGAEAVDFWEELYVSFIGSDGLEYWTEPCSMGPAPMGPTEVQPAESLEVELCAFAPTSATEGAHILVATYEMDAAAYWRV